MLAAWLFVLERSFGSCYLRACVHPVPRCVSFKHTLEYRWKPLVGPRTYIWPDHAYSESPLLALDSTEIRLLSFQALMLILGIDHLVHAWLRAVPVPAVGVLLNAPL
jgi:hypothetical protein